jgi:Telomere length regulation protein.
LITHVDLTTLLLVTVSYFPQSSNHITALAVSPIFISGVGTYVGHLDDSVRRCGMLAAEVVAQRAGKKLDFGDWEGDDPGKSWAREIRQVINTRDIDADLQAVTSSAAKIGEISSPGVLQDSSATTVSSKATPTNIAAGYDSDDSLTGYASPSSSRSTSPTPSELKELEKDPTIGVGIKKIPRPVYLAQLGEMVRSTSGAKENDANYEADKIEMALNCADELIRRKQGYGTELGIRFVHSRFVLPSSHYCADENAVNLVYGLVGLQDNYDLEGFEAKRQVAVNALVACCPRKAAPYVIALTGIEAYVSFPGPSLKNFSRISTQPTIVMSFSMPLPWVHAS